MAKDTDNILDDQEIEEKEAPQDVRGAIKAAFDEHRDDDDKDGKELREDVRGQSEQKQRATRQDKEDESDSDARGDKDLQKADKRSSRLPDRKDDKEEPEVEAGDKKDDVTIDPPPFYKVKGKATWDKLSPEDKQTIITREKEVSDGFQQVSQRIRAIEDIERVISPRLPMIQQLGISPVQTVDRLFQWMDALQGPNKVESFKELAKSVGLNPAQFTQANTNSQTENDSVTGEPPPWFSEFTGAVDQKLAKVTAIEQQLENQSKVAAANAVSQWAKDKPYYQQVAPLMGQLLQAGIVGLKEDGSVDLDGAYAQAIKLDPTVAGLIQQEAATKAANEAKEKATKEAKEKSEKLTRARRAGSGLRPAPASGPSALPGKAGLNGKQDNSVRGSIRAALQELQE